MDFLSRRRFIVGAAALAAGALHGLAAAPAEAASEALFDGHSLTGWKETGFAGRGEVKITDGQLVLSQGDVLTGVNCTRAFPKTNYEISLEAMRVEGGDFFCALTFPYGETHCTFVVGGWGGGIVGISSINGEDASENETSQSKKFDNGRWYRLRLKVTPAKIEAWIDEEQMVNLDTQGKKLGMRAGEIELSEPFGLASFRTTAALRNITLRKW